MTNLITLYKIKIATFLFILLEDLIMGWIIRLIIGIPIFGLPRYAIISTEASLRFPICSHLI